MSHLADDTVEKFKDMPHIEVQLASQDGSYALNNPKIDPIAEKRLVRKLDWILLPLSAFACISIPFVDRMPLIDRHYRLYEFY
jgi:hypothetical protein